MFTPTQIIALIFLVATLSGALGLIAITVWIPPGERNDRLFRRVLLLTLGCLGACGFFAAVLPMFH